MVEEFTNGAPASGDEDRDLSISRSFGMRSWLQDTLETVLLAVILFFVINALTGRYQVHGQSMIPSLQEGQYLIASKVAFWLHTPARGDIIVLDPPNNDGGIPYIKRVIGLPGDVVEVRDQRIWVNGIALNEPYINAQPNYNGNWIVAENMVFVLGDNRNDSSDSHTWGLLPQDQILGKAFFSYWPPEKWGIIPHYTFPELSGTQ
ncbi:MAG: signal peptidase I [Anaerolineales bacterium]|nr:MAG: signal peptidase I [Anaerolineales bacterium]